MRTALRSLAGVLLALVTACAASSEPQDAGDRFPTSSAYAPGVMERIDFTAGVTERWRISALQTPARDEAPWKVVIITGTPSWSEFWAPTVAAAPANREVIVADRPGFRTSEPNDAVRDISKQADALAPMLETRPGQRTLLVGQSFGAPVAALMASRHPDRVSALLLVSAYFGDRGPTARRMVAVGRIAQPLLGRDLRNAMAEISAQGPQLPAVWTAFEGLRQPVVFIHGDDDTFVPLEADQRIAAAYNHTFIAVPGGDHFLNACCVPALWAAMEQAISKAESLEAALPASDRPADPGAAGGHSLR